MLLGTGTQYGNPLSPFGVAADGAGAYPPAPDNPEGTNPPINIGINDGRVVGSATGTYRGIGYNINFGQPEQTVRTPELAPPTAAAGLGSIPTWAYGLAGIAGLYLLTKG